MVYVRRFIKRWRKERNYFQKHVNRFKENIDIKHDQAGQIASKRKLFLKIKRSLVIFVLMVWTTVGTICQEKFFYKNEHRSDAMVWVVVDNTLNWV